MKEEVGMRFNRKALVIFLSFVLVAFSFCGDSTSTTQNNNPNTPANFDIEENPIEIPEGLGMTGIFDGKKIEMQEDGDILIFISLLDKNENGLPDEEDILGIFIENTDEFRKRTESFIQIGLNIHNLPALRTHKLLFLDSGYVNLAPDGSESFIEGIESGNVYFTYLMKAKTGLVAGKFEIILKNKKGSFKGKFNGMLNYVKP